MLCIVTAKRQPDGQQSSLIGGSRGACGATLGEPTGSASKAHSKAAKTPAKSTQMSPTIDDGQRCAPGPPVQ